MKARWLLGIFAALSLATGTAHAELPRGVQTGIKIDRFTMNGAKGVKWAAQAIRAEKNDVTMDAFGVSDKKVARALINRARKGVSVRVNADPENIVKKAMPAIAAAGADVRPWGGDGIRKGVYKISKNDRKVHAKTVHVGDKSWLSTASLTRDDALDSIDATAMVSGQSAAAARAITEAAHRDDIPGLRLAAVEARAHGVLLNDATSSIHHLTGAMHDIIDGAKDELVVSMKAVESVDFASKLSDAASRGVKVTLLTHASKMSPEAKAALSPAIRVVGDPFGVLHANMLVADRKVGLFGSAHATRRALGEGARRKSFEMGYVVQHPEALGQMRQAVLDFVPKEESH